MGIQRPIWVHVTTYLGTCRGAAAKKYPTYNMMWGGWFLCSNPKSIVILFGKNRMVKSFDPQIQKVQIYLLIIFSLFQTVCTAHQICKNIDFDKNFLEYKLSTMYPGTMWNILQTAHYTVHFENYVNCDHSCLLMSISPFQPVSALITLLPSV